jgi:tripartite-type tricarboxylate transporter receptor subunit TctC
VPRFVIWIISIGVSVIVAGAVSAQDFPSKPIRIITTGIGSVADTASRLIAPGLASGLGQQVIVDNRAAGVMPGAAVSKAQPDGYTLLLYGNPHWLAPFMLENVPYDPVKDFAPITLAIKTPTILVVHPSVPVKSVNDLIALAKAKPGLLNYGSAAIGSSSYLAAELFKTMAGVNIVFISYKATAAVMTDLIGGQLHMAFATAGSAMPHVKSGRLRAVAVTSAQPTALAPGLPAIAASGLPGYEVVSSQAVFAPAGTPASIINRLNSEIVRVLNGADIKEKFFNLGVETVGDSPQECAAAIKAEMAKMGKLIKKTGIHGQ